MKIGFIATVGAASLVAAANAGFTGWVGVVSETATHYKMSVFAGMSSSSDKLLNVFNMNIAAVGSSFVQGGSAATNKWRPTLGVAAMGDTDSFVTLGGFDDGGTYIAGDTTTADPNFTNYATSNATTIAANAGWFSSDPSSEQVVATDLNAFMNGGAYRALGSDSASFGVWVAHLVVLKSASFGPGSVNFNGFAAFNTGANGESNKSLQFAIPAPGAFALLGMAGFASRRRRA